MLEADINLWAVLAATVAYFVIGGLWYSLLFAKPWMKLSGVSAETASKDSNMAPYALTFLLLLVLNYVLAHLLVFAGAATVIDGLVTGAWVWLGLVATTMAIDAMYAGRPHKLTAINAGYHLAGIMAAATVLVVWV